jgi:hypothetical protein
MSIARGIGLHGFGVELRRRPVLEEGPVRSPEHGLTVEQLEPGSAALVHLALVPTAQQPEVLQGRWPTVGPVDDVVSVAP